MYFQFFSIAHLYACDTKNHFLDSRWFITLMEIYEGTWGYLFQLGPNIYEGTYNLLKPMQLIMKILHSSCPPFLKGERLEIFGSERQWGLEKILIGGALTNRGNSFKREVLGKLILVFHDRVKTFAKCQFSGIQDGPKWLFL